VRNMAQIIHAPALIGMALEDVMIEIAAEGSWRDRRKAEWLLAKLEACIAHNDELADLRGPLTPVEIMAGCTLGLRHYLYDRHRMGRGGDERNSRRAADGPCSGD
jgi:hypothetical protein